MCSGAASTTLGTKVWVVDANKSVYVYDTRGALQGSWAAGGLQSTAQLEGIATNGTDVWLVDNNTDKVYRYTNAAGLINGTQNASSSFSLNSSNKDAKDIVTDGTYLWVVNDSKSSDKVFKYMIGGTYVGSWTISTSGASSPTGITLDPSNPSAIWIVDSGTDKVYQYDNAAGLTSGSKSANSSWALAAGNTNPQGIADPPPPSAIRNNPNAIVVNNNEVVSKDVVLAGVGPVPMPWFGTPASNVSSAMLPSVETKARRTDDIMSSFGLLSRAPQAPAIPTQTTPVDSRSPIDPSDSEALETADEHINELIDLLAKVRNQ